ncbi:ubiquitin-specific protease doa4 [Balamuthia mandrillaris]
MEASSQYCPHVRKVQLAFQQQRFQSLDLKERIHSRKLACCKCRCKMPNVWACLEDRCTFIGCGRNQGEHMLSHFMQQRQHRLCLNVETQQIWCYECDEEVLECTCPDEQEAQLIERIRGLVVLPSARSSSRSLSNIKRKDGTKHSSKGLCGLSNLGNTCYMNASLQCLNNSPLAFYFRKCALIQLSKHRHIYRLSWHFAEFTAHLWSGKLHSYKPVDLLRDMVRVNPLFAGYGQQDAQEFLRCIIDALHEELKEVTQPSKLVLFNEQEQLNKSLERSKKRENPKTSQVKKKYYRSIVSDLFEGTLLSHVKCLRCGKSSPTLDPFYDLSVSIPSDTTLNRLIDQEQQHVPANLNNREGRGLFTRMGQWLGLSTRTVSLMDCLRCYCMSECLTGVDRYNCDFCRRRNDSQKYLRLVHLPKILCIHLKRFRHDSYFSSKISDQVTFPLTGLNMAPFCEEYGGNEDMIAHTTYDLIGLINHRGGLGGGHYVAYCKNQKNGKWWEFDDSYVTEASESQVQGTEAYVLFYQRRSPENDENGEEIKAIRASIKAYHCWLNAEFSATAANGAAEEEEEQPSYLSREWYYRWLTVEEEAGPIDHRSFICEHGGLRPEQVAHVPQRLISIPRNAWQQLYATYGGGPEITRLESCGKCQKLDLRRNEEKQAIASMDRDSLQPSEVWYLMHAEWLTQWHCFVRGGPLPGPIPNHLLLEENDQTGLRPLKGLKPVTHYRGVIPDVWWYLFDRYGGGPEIRRDVINIYKLPCADRA